MWHRLVAIILASVVFYFGATTAFAAGPTTVGPIQLVGQLTADNQNSSQVQLAADATNGSAWHLQAIIMPTAGAEGRSSRTIGLTGNFALTDPNGVTSTGNLQGQLNREGFGTIQLTNTAGTTKLSGTIAVDQAGDVQLTISGQIAVAQSGTATTQPTNNTFWYITRAAGFTAYLLLFLNVCLGLEVRSHFFDTVFPRWQSFDLHQFTALVAIGFAILHVLSLLGDTFIHFNIAQVFIPFNAPYRPFWTGFGVISFYLLLAITASFYVRRFIGQKTWRSIHYLTFFLFLFVLIHGIFSGTDSGSNWARLIYWVTGFTVLVLTLRRIGDSSEKKPVEASKSRVGGPRPVR